MTFVLRIKSAINDAVICEGPLPYRDLRDAVRDARRWAREIIEMEEREGLGPDPHRVILVTNEDDEILASVPFLNS